MDSTSNPKEYPHLLTRGYESNLAKTEISDGKIRVAVDTRQLFLDNGNERLEITDVIKGFTEEEILSNILPLQKIYLSSDTHKLYVYNFSDLKWEICGEPNSKYVSIKFGTSVEWSESNPVLESGELAYDSTENGLKIGDGKTNYNDLSFIFTSVDMKKEYDFGDEDNSSSDDNNTDTGKDYDFGDEDTSSTSSNDSSDDIDTDYGSEEDSTSSSDTDLDYGSEDE
jgi:hypothetical protein